MGYRQHEHKPPKANRKMQKLTTPSEIYLHLNTTSTLAIPCWYDEIRHWVPAHHHCRPYHDHVGWPSPDHPDHSCQAWDFAHSCCSHDEHKHHCDHCKHYLDMGKLFPIHLWEEGYRTVSVVIEHIDGDERVELTGTGEIDQANDWVVRLYLESLSTVASGSKPYEPAKFRISAYVEAPATQNAKKKKDLVCLAEVTVLPVAVE